MTTARATPIGPVEAALNIRLVAKTSTTVTIAWDVPSWQEGFVPTIDRSETLTDGKRHLNSSKTQGSVKIGRKLDGRVHFYSVNVLGARATETGVSV